MTMTEPGAGLLDPGRPVIEVYEASTSAAVRAGSPLLRMSASRWGPALFRVRGSTTRSRSKRLKAVTCQDRARSAGLEPATS